MIQNTWKEHQQFDNLAHPSVNLNDNQNLHFNSKNNNGTKEVTNKEANLLTTSVEVNK